MATKKRRGVKPRPMAERFWEKVNRRGPDECWLWQASGHERGYGLIGDGKRRTHRAHRVSWELHNGPIPKGMYVLHHCDTPACVNPRHLFVGTQRDNLRDCWAKGRASPPPVFYGEDNNAPRRLTRSHVRTIRRRVARGDAVRGIASDYDVSETTIRDIHTGRTWAHLE